jgi:phosphoribosylformylglycinamidine synthase
MAWHKDDALPAGPTSWRSRAASPSATILRCGAIAARSPIAAAVQAHARRGGYVLGVCNGFQVLTEMRLLPGALMRNAGLRFICRTATLRVATQDSPFTHGYAKGQTVRLPIAHHDGNYSGRRGHPAPAPGRGPHRLHLRRPGERLRLDIAGVLSGNRRVLGLMPHPERAGRPVHGNTDGLALFRGLVSQLASA